MIRKCLIIFTFLLVNISILATSSPFDGKPFFLPENYVMRANTSLRQAFGDTYQMVAIEVFLAEYPNTEVKNIVTTCEKNNAVKVDFLKDKSNRVQQVKNCKKMNSQWMCTLVTKKPCKVFNLNTNGGIDKIFTIALIEVKTTYVWNNIVGFIVE
jgi:hypothetical protein